VIGGIRAQLENKEVSIQYGVSVNPKNVARMWMTLWRKVKLTVPWSVALALRPRVLPG